MLSLPKSFKVITLVVAVASLVACSPASTQQNSSIDPSDAPQPKSKTSKFVGRVVEIIDGETIDVVDDLMNNHRIRLQGIDAPKKNQAFGTESTRALEHLVSGRDVTVEWTRRDNSRIVGRVLLNDQDVGLEQLRAGMARHFKQHLNEQSKQDRELYDLLESSARLARRGIWTEFGPGKPKTRSDYSQPQLDRSEDLSSADTAAAETPEALIRGNRRSRIYHWPGCPNYDDIASHNRVPFSSRAEAEQAGYRAARNCR